MRHLRPAAVTVGVCALTTSITALGAPTAKADSATHDKLEIVLDASGSMADPTTDGTPKIVAARKALTTMVNGMSDDSQVGMRVYGATAPPGKDTQQACSDSQQVVPVQTLDRTALKSAIHRYAPKGQTPTAYALQQSAKDLGSAGQRSIVLVSDGESTCSPDPCDTAKELAAKGINLRVDVIGFKVGRKARSQLQCISSVTSGKYFDASDTKSLSSALETVKTRATQPFSVAGRAVTGTRTSSGAPDIGPGHWTDTVPADGQTAKYYRLRHSMPGSSFLVGVTSRPKAEDSQLELSVTAPDGTDCGSIRPSAMGFAKTSRDLLTGVLSTAPRNDPESSCTSDDLVLKVQQTDWGDDVAGTPMQLDVIETPAPTNGASASDDDSSSTTWPNLQTQSSKGTSVGGSGLATATRLQPGTTTVELLPGEYKFFKVSADWGQQVQALATAEQNPAYASTTSFRRLSTDILSPAGGVVTSLFPKGAPRGAYGALTHSELIDDDGGRVAAVTKPIRLANRESYSDSVVGSSVAGDYYIAVGLSTKADGKETVRTPLKVDLQVATPGTAGADAPQFAPGQLVKTSAGTTIGTAGASTQSKAGQSKSPSSGASDESTAGGADDAAQAQAAEPPQVSGDRGTNWALVGGLAGGAGALAILGTGAALAVRRRH